MTRRRFSEEFRQQVVAETRQAGATVSGVALRHRLNANMVHKWRRAVLGRHAPQAEQPTLVPVVVDPAPALPMAAASPSSAMEPAGALQIELPRARIEVRGRVDLDVLHTVLTVLRPR